MSYRHHISLAIALLIGCSQETAILLEVSRAETSRVVECDHLRFFAGSTDISSVEYSPRTILTGQPEFVEKVMLEPGRDVRDDPFRLLVRQGETKNNELVIAVGCFDNNENLMSYAVQRQPIRFVADSVQQWPLILQDNSGEAKVSATGCFDHAGDDILINTVQDLDCDGIPNDTDCEPANALVGSSMAEICDGIDNNCNDVSDFPYTEGGCYGTVPGSPEGLSCLIGERQCLESSGAGWGTCHVEEEQPDVLSGVVDTLCSEIDGFCATQSDPFRCANLRAATETHSCDVYFCDEPGSIKPCYRPSIPLPTDANNNGNTCRWTLTPAESHGQPWIQTSGDGVVVWSPSTGEYGSVANGCDGRFKVSGYFPKDLIPQSYMIHLNVDGLATKAILLRLNPVIVTDSADCPGGGAGSGLPPAIVCPTLAE